MNRECQRADSGRCGGMGGTTTLSPLPLLPSQGEGEPFVPLLPSVGKGVRGWGLSGVRFPFPPQWDAGQGMGAVRCAVPLLPSVGEGVRGWGLSGVRSPSPLSGGRG